MKVRSSNVEKVIVVILISLFVVFACDWQYRDLRKEELRLSIEQHKLEIRYLTLQLQLIDDSAVIE